MVFHPSLCRILTPTPFIKSQPQFLMYPFLPFLSAIFSKYCLMLKFFRRFAARVSQVILLVYPNGRKFQGPQGLTFEGHKRAIQIKHGGISYDMLKKIIGAKLKLQSHQIISSLTYRFPISQSTHTDLEILDSEDVMCMISAAEKHSHVKVLELYVEIDVVVGSSSIPTHLVQPNASLKSPSSNAENIGLSNNDEDRSSKDDEDGGGVPNDESSDNIEVAGGFNASSSVVGLASSIAAASPQRAGEDSSFSPSSRSIQQPRSWTYHVFLSFRGEDTRKGFTDHLFSSLERKGIITFRDEKNVERGEMISSELLKAIEESVFAITIFSPNYASSTWCLDELVKIVECKNNLGQFVVPIFYDVYPSDVRHQKGSFGEALRRLEERFGQNNDKVLRWRNALKEVANCSGFDSRDQFEANFVDTVAEYMHKQVMKKLPSCIENLASRVEEVIRLVDTRLKDVRFAYMGHRWHE